MKLTIKVLGLTLLDLDWTTEDPTPDPPAGDVGTYLTVGFQPPHQDPDRPTWPYEEERHGTRRV